MHTPAHSVSSNPSAHLTTLINCTHYLSTPSVSSFPVSCLLQMKATSLLLSCPPTLFHTYVIPDTILIKLNSVTIVTLKIIQLLYDQLLND